MTARCPVGDDGGERVGELGVFGVQPIESLWHGQFVADVKVASSGGDGVVEGQPRHDAMDGMNVGSVGRAVDQQRQAAIPRTRTIDRSAAVRQLPVRGVAVVPVCDQGMPRTKISGHIVERGRIGDGPEPMGDAVRRSRPRPRRRRPSRRRRPMPRAPRRRRRPS